ncbi:hypothetical protein BGW39_000966 [Mortierella sp. 14UC]|nr:hypothetical protein BGW39_000966 [Mortierella sp. 14UC]
MADTSLSTPALHTNQALLIVELLEHIGSHLAPPDLLACVQVSHHWSSVMIPCLWHTIDDRLYSWSDILTVHLDSRAPRLSRTIKAEQEAEQADNNRNGIDGPPADDEKALSQRRINAWPSKRAETLQWIYGVFKKYGRHIRILRVSWPIVIRVAGVAEHCANVRALTAHFAPMRNTPSKTREEGIARRQRDEEEQAWMNNYADPTADWQGFWQCVNDDEKEARLWAVNSHLAYDDPAWLYWGVARRFWVLVLRNPTIEHFCLGRSLMTFSPLVSQEFVYHVLKTLPRLKFIDNQFMELDFQIVLERTSTTHGGSSNRSLFYHNSVPGHLQLDKDFAHLTSLVIRGISVKSMDILMFLKRLVNLNQLTVWRINSDGDSRPPFLDTDDNYEERSRKFPLTGLHLVDLERTSANFMLISEAIAQQLIPRLPFLTELNAEVLTQEMARALASHCRQFQSFRQKSNRKCIHQEDGDGIKTELNVVGILLESCPNLTTIDAIQCRIDAAHLLEHPWVCEETLETFCCQIVGVDRLTPDEYQSLSLEQGDSSRSIAEGKYKRSQEQHSRVYERLARLTRLQTLDLGGNIIDYWMYSFLEDSGFELVKDVNGRLFLEFSTPIMDSLEFSLASGLDQLVSLKNLKVFGFEGHDHRIERAELEWIARHWPKLTVMRGLHISHSETLVMTDIKTAEQREFMQKLRPYVIHEAADP